MQLSFTILLFFSHYIYFLSVINYTTSSARDSKIIIELTPNQLIEATAAVSARFNIGVRPQTVLLASICNKSGLVLEDMAISRSTVYWKRYKTIETLGDQLKQDIIETLKGKHLVLHFDGK